MADQCHAQCSAAGELGLFDLPNEILMNVLSSFSTQLLLSMTAVSHRFHAVILRVVHRRLLLAAALKDFKLILECYHPASKSTEPYLFCDYLGTPGLSSDAEGEGWLYGDGAGMGQLGRLSSLYSRFRPVRHDYQDRVYRPHPAGDIPNHPGTTQPPRSSPMGDFPEALVCHNVNLDPDECFSQLCISTALVRLGPRRGVFETFVNVSNGFVRVWRNWLGDRVREKGMPDGKSSTSISEDAESNSHAKGKRKLDRNDSEDRTLWTDSQKNVGMRFHTTEKSWQGNTPILLRKDEEPAVTYALEYEELLIKTTHLLLAVEQTMLQNRNDSSGKAMIFGSFSAPETTSQQ